MGAVTYEETDVLCTESLGFPTTKISSDQDSLVKFYSFRWWLVRSLTTGVPCLPRWLTGGKSALELFLIIAAFAITLTISQDLLNGKTSGKLAEAVACFMIVSAFRGNNILTIFLGISYERAIQIHKVAGVLTIFLGISHMIIVQRKFLYAEKTGIALLCLFTMTAASYLIKKKYFEVFYAYHVASYIAILGVGYRHGPKKLVYTVIVYGVDMFARWYLGSYKTEADVTAMPNDVVKISFKKNFKYSPGQYCFVSVPALSHLQFHVSAEFESCILSTSFLLVHIPLNSVLYVNEVCTVPYHSSCSILFLILISDVNIPFFLLLLLLIISYLISFLTSSISYLTSFFILPYFLCRILSLI
jgi:hypothetical protein